METGKQRDKYAVVADTMSRADGTPGGRVGAIDAIRVADDNGLDPVRLLRTIANLADLPDPHP